MPFHPQPLFVPFQPLGVDVSVTALTYYVLIYVVANLSVFAIIASIEEHNNDTVQMDSYNGLYKTNPRLAFLMTLA